MFTAQVAKVNWKTAASPNELEVVSLFNFAESFKDAPEAGDNGVVTTDIESGYRLESLNRYNFITSAPPFESLPVAEVEDRFIVLDDSQEAQADGFNLFLSFIHASLEHFLAELINVVLGDLDGLAFGAERNLLASRKDSREVLIDSRIEMFVTQVLRMVLQVA